MPARASKTTSIDKAAPPNITHDQIAEVMFPELSKDTFKINETTYRIRVLPYKFEQMFRRAAMPILEAELKPIERAIFSLSTDQAMITNDLKITESISKSEVDADVFLLNAVLVICLSQDPLIVKNASEGRETTADAMMKIEKTYKIRLDNLEVEPSTRAYFREIVRKQSEKMKLVQLLGESLMARCAETSSLVGVRSQFDSLKQDFTRQVSKFLEKAGKVVGVSASSFSPSTATGSETNQTEEQPKKPEQLPAEAGPAAEQPAHVQ